MSHTPDFAFTGRDLLRLREPLVYVLRDSAGLPLYVGSGCNGAMRPLDPKHHAIADMPSDGRLELYCCESKAEALRLERRLIRELKPSRNRPLRARHRFKPVTHKPKREITGVRRTGHGWQVYTQAGGKFRSKHFPPDTPMETMLQWREEATSLYGRARPKRITNRLLTPLVS